MAILGVIYKVFVSTNSRQTPPPTPSAQEEFSAHFWKVLSTSNDNLKDLTGGKGDSIYEAIPNEYIDLTDVEAPKKVEDDDYVVMQKGGGYENV